MKSKLNTPLTMKTPKALQRMGRSVAVTKKESAVVEAEMDRDAFEKTLDLMGALRSCSDLDQQFSQESYDVSEVEESSMDLESGANSSTGERLIDLLKARSEARQEEELLRGAILPPAPMKKKNSKLATPKANNISVPVEVATAPHSVDESALASHGVEERRETVPSATSHHSKSTAKIAKPPLAPKKTKLEKSKDEDLAKPIKPKRSLSKILLKKIGSRFNKAAKKEQDEMDLRTLDSHSKDEAQTEVEIEGMSVVDETPDAVDPVPEPVQEDEPEAPVEKAIQPAVSTEGAKSLAFNSKEVAGFTKMEKAPVAEPEAATFCDAVEDCIDLLCCVEAQAWCLFGSSLDPSSSSSAKKEMEETKEAEPQPEEAMPEEAQPEEATPPQPEETVPEPTPAVSPLNIATTPDREAASDNCLFSSMETAINNACPVLDPMSPKKTTCGELRDVACGARPVCGDEDDDMDVMPSIAEASVEESSIHEQPKAAAVPEQPPQTTPADDSCPEISMDSATKDKVADAADCVSTYRDNESITTTQAHQLEEALNILSIHAQKLGVNEAELLEAVQEAKAEMEQ